MIKEMMQIKPTETAGDKYGSPEEEYPGIASTNKESGLMNIV